MEKPVVIFGAGGLGKAALEIFQSNNVVVYCFLDDNTSLIGTEINGVSVLGKTDDDEFLKFLGSQSEVFVALDENKYRKSIVDFLYEEKKVMPINAIHKTAYISKSANLGHGNLINMSVNVGTGAKIGNHCLLHSRTILDHEAELEDFVQVGAGSTINAGVKIGKNAFIGSGVTIISGVSVGPGARVGAGSVVVEDVKKNETVFGNPAKTVLIQ
ncbi:MAG: acetyltransferase [Bacteroidota bacterium]|nr:acetyltransferase [Bacteroidota bacterium]